MSAGSNPAPRSRTVTLRRPGAGRLTSTHASPVPACAATFDSASRTAFAIAAATGAGTTGAGTSGAGTSGAGLAGPVLASTAT
jgi:hypothetical protein